MSLEIRMQKLRYVWGYKTNSRLWLWYLDMLKQKTRNY